MQYKNTIEAVYVQLGEIQQIVANFGSDGQIHAIDLDLSLEKLRHIYDLIKSIQMESVLDSGSEIKTYSVDSENRDTLELYPELEIVDQKDETESKAVTIKEKVIQDEDISDESIKTRAEMESRVVTKDKKVTLGDSFQREDKSLNAELSNKKEKSDLSDKLKSKPISSLSGSIGINEKFELINNLFNGDNAKYSHTLEILDTATNFNEAYNYLSSNFSWDMNNEYVQRILELIRRKLIKRKNEQ